MVVNMKNKIFFCFIILLTLFLSISVISASENMTCDNLTSVDGNEVLANETDLDNIEDVENKSSTDIVANDKVSYVDYNDEFGSVISAGGFDILCPSEATSFVPSYSFKFHLSFNTFNSFVFSFFSTIHGVSVS